jgi:hypothetical protein
LPNEIERKTHLKLYVDCRTWLSARCGIKKKVHILHEIERKTNLKLYVHCLTWPSGLRKIGAEEGAKRDRKTNLKL